MDEAQQTDTEWAEHEHIVFKELDSVLEPTRYIARNRKELMEQLPFDGLWGVYLVKRRNTIYVGVSTNLRGRLVNPRPKQWHRRLHSRFWSRWSWYVWQRGVQLIAWREAQDNITYADLLQMEGAAD